MFLFLKFCYISGSSASLSHVIYLVYCCKIIMRIFLFVNVVDLVPREAVEKWLTYLRQELPAVAFKCSTQEQRSNLGWKTTSKAAKTSNILATSDCLGAETLIKLLKNYSRSHEVIHDFHVYRIRSSFLTNDLSFSFRVLFSGFD